MSEALDVSSHFIYTIPAYMRTLQLYVLVRAYGLLYRSRSLHYWNGTLFERNSASKLDCA